MEINQRDKSIESDLSDNEACDNIVFANNNEEDDVDDTIENNEKYMDGRECTGGKKIPELGKTSAEDVNSTEKKDYYKDSDDDDESEEDEEIKQKKKSDSDSVEDSEEEGQEDITKTYLSNIQHKIGVQNVADDAKNNILQHENTENSDSDSDDDEDEESDDVEDDEKQKNASDIDADKLKCDINVRDKNKDNIHQENDKDQVVSDASNDKKEEKKKKIMSDKKDRENPNNGGCSSNSNKKQLTNKTVLPPSIDSVEKIVNKKRKLNTDFISRKYLVTVASGMGLEMIENDLQKVVEKRVRVSCKEIIRKCCEIVHNDKRKKRSITEDDIDKIINQINI